jgi:hypothetical protein
MQKKRRSSVLTPNFDTSRLVTSPPVIAPRIPPRLMSTNRRLACAGAKIALAKSQ